MEDWWVGCDWCDETISETPDENGRVFCDKHCREMFYERELIGQKETMPVRPRTPK